MENPDNRLHKLTDAFVATHGYWNEGWNALLQLDPDFFEINLRFNSLPWRKGPLELKVKEFICIAINAATTHLNEEAVRTHIRNALKLGATKEEITEVLQLASTLGLHSFTIGVPALFEEYEKVGRRAELGNEDDVLADPCRSRLKETFVANRGYWSGFWAKVLTLDPDLFEACLDFTSHPWLKGPLSSKVKELVYIGIDIATTHLFDIGLRIHYQNAIAHGATKEEIVEVLQLASGLGVQSSTFGLPILIEELERAKAEDQPIRKKG
jgi:alkylhydroperoxidase/carboxymuconolactone decarboxylase family protein YurZ